MGTNNIAFNKNAVYKVNLVDGNSYIINIDNIKTDNLVIAKNTFQRFDNDSVFIHEQKDIPGEKTVVHRFIRALPSESTLLIFTNNIVSITELSDAHYKEFQKSIKHQVANS